MCIDQQQFVTYDPEFNPLISTQKPPGFDVKDVVYNWQVRDTDTWHCDRAVVQRERAARLVTP